MCCDADYNDNNNGNTNTDNIEDDDDDDYIDMRVDRKINLIILLSSFYFSLSGSLMGCYSNCATINRIVMLANLKRLNKRHRRLSSINRKREREKIEALSEGS